MSDNAPVPAPARRQWWVLPDDEWQLATNIATQLCEKERDPRLQIAAIVRFCGPDFTEQIFQQTLEVETNGGMLVADGSRRRTPGGVFFFLARNQMPIPLRRRIFPNEAENQRREKKRRPKRVPQPTTPFEWEKRAEIAQTLIEARGIANTVKFVLLARPEYAEQQDGFVAVGLTLPPKQLALPKGVPYPPETTLRCIALIATKQWKKVEAALADPDDLLLVEGVCLYDHEHGEFVMYVNSASTKGLEIQKREQPKP